ncbi:hypothetical protein FOMPIDRAFT_1052175 [Fomitopsis schrenkii]|uniref:Uncharacterized protein n=1 Tax=Fomitopsis schrenkii TaxID=2126942 RepID=S8E2E4_FOMSC|nr:hypothetical protein FOMPIDRAFT_1052175 [Fomitopsis schrenkii]
MFHRLSAIHTLEIVDGFRQRMEMGFVHVEVCREAAQLLADVLEGTTNLRRLVLNNAETWLADMGRIAGAIGSMLHLREVDLRGLGANTSGLIQGLHSRPYKLTLGEELAPSLWKVQHSFAFDNAFRMPSILHFVTLGYAFHVLPASTYS